MKGQRPSALAPKAQLTAAPSTASIPTSTTGALASTCSLCHPCLPALHPTLLSCSRHPFGITKDKAGLSNWFQGLLWLRQSHPQAWVFPPRTESTTCIGPALSHSSQSLNSPTTTWQFTPPGFQPSLALVYVGCWPKRPWQP